MFDREIRSWQRSGHLRKLHLVGPRDAKFDQRSERLTDAYSDAGTIVRHGQLQPPEISALLARAQFALSNASTETWSKSSAFMAYAAHGCAIVVKSRSNSEPLSL